MAVCKRCGYTGPYYCHKCGSQLITKPGWLGAIFFCRKCRAKGPLARCNNCHAHVHA